MNDGGPNSTEKRGQTGATGSAGNADGGRPDAVERLPAPRPDRSPEDVVETVLSALSANDDPFEDAGVVTAFQFASPALRGTAGGSVDAFREFLTDPINGTLIDHEETRRGRLVVEGGSATEKVVVAGEDGTSTYAFEVQAVEGGKYDGCWLLSEIELVQVGESPDHQYMPLVDFDGTEVKCAEGDVLREVLLRASGVSPHNDAARYANCNGNGVCGTCAVEIEGAVTEKTGQEKRRLKLPPHRGNDDPNFRLSCQCRVLGDLRVHKHDGTWGQHVEEYAAGTEETPDAEPIRISAEELHGDGGEAVDDDGNYEEMDLSDDARAVLDEAEERLEE